MAEVVVPERPGKLKLLMKALEDLNRRAGRPSLREIAKGQPFTYASVHALFVKTRESSPSWRVLKGVVLVLAREALGADPEQVLRQFHEMWVAADEQPFDTQTTQAVATVKEGMAWDLGQLTPGERRAIERQIERIPTDSLRNLMLELHRLYRQTGGEILEASGFNQGAVQKLFTSPHFYEPHATTILLIAKAFATLHTTSVRLEEVAHLQRLILKAEEEKPFDAADNRAPNEKSDEQGTQAPIATSPENPHLPEGHFRNLIVELRGLHVVAGVGITEIAEEINSTREKVSNLLESATPMLPPRNLLLKVCKVLFDRLPQMDEKASRRRFGALWELAVEELFKAIGTPDPASYESLMPPPPLPSRETATKILTDLGLTDNELKVSIQLAVTSRPLAEISSDLHITDSTARTHMQMAFLKLGTRSRRDLVTKIQMLALDARRRE